MTPPPKIRARMLSSGSVPRPPDALARVLRWSFPWDGRSEPLGSWQPYVARSQPARAALAWSFLDSPGGSATQCWRGEAPDKHLRERWRLPFVNPACQTPAGSQTGGGRRWPRGHPIRPSIPRRAWR
jgi:hypothetical protein